MNKVKIINKKNPLFAILLLVSLTACGFGYKDNSQAGLSGDPDNNVLNIDGQEHNNSGDTGNQGGDVGGDSGGNNGTDNCNNNELVTASSTIDNCPAPDTGNDNGNTGSGTDTNSSAGTSGGSGNDANSSAGTSGGSGTDANSSAGTSGGSGTDSGNTGSGTDANSSAGTSGGSGTDSGNTGSGTDTNSSAGTSGGSGTDTNSSAGTSGGSGTDSGNTSSGTDTNSSAGSGDGITIETGGGTNPNDGSGLESENLTDGGSGTDSGNTGSGTDTNSSAGTSGGSGTDSGTGEIISPEKLTTSINIDVQHGKLPISWTQVADATHYDLYVITKDGVEHPLLLGATVESYDYYYKKDNYPMAYWELLGASIAVKACKLNQCQTTTQEMPDLKTAIEYIKATNTEESNNFGSDLKLSNDGKTLVAFARGETSKSTGVNGDQQQAESNEYHGAAYVYEKDDEEQWHWKAYLKNSKLGFGIFFGQTNISSDGNKIALASWANTSEDAFIDMFKKDANGNWHLDNYSEKDRGYSSYHPNWAFTMSGDGNTVALSCAEPSRINESIMNRLTNCIDIFKRDEHAGWVKEFSTIHNLDFLHSGSFGFSALSQDGSTLAVAVIYATWLIADDGSNITGIFMDGLPEGRTKPNEKPSIGAVLVYSKNDEGVWNPNPVYIRSPNPTPNYGPSYGPVFSFGPLKLSSDGTRMLVQEIDNKEGARLYLYEKNSAGVWSLNKTFTPPDINQITVKYPELANGHNYGYNGGFAITPDGKTIAARLIAIDGFKHLILFHVFKEDESGNWTKIGDFKWHGHDWHPYRDIGRWRLTISEDGLTMAVAHEGDPSDATGVGGDPNNSRKIGSGAVWVY